MQLILAILLLIIPMLQTCAHEIRTTLKSLAGALKESEAHLLPMGIYAEPSYHPRGVRAGIQARLALLPKGHPWARYRDDSTAVDQIARRTWAGPLGRLTVRLKADGTGALSRKPGPYRRPPRFRSTISEFQWRRVGDRLHLRVTGAPTLAQLRQRGVPEYDMPVASTGSAN